MQKVVGSSPIIRSRKAPLRPDEFANRVKEDTMKAEVGDRIVVASDKPPRHPAARFGPNRFRLSPVFGSVALGGCRG
jgi:hypothetical protein